MVNLAIWRPGPGSIGDLEELQALGAEVLYVKGNVGIAADRERLVAER